MKRTTIFLMMFLTALCCALTVSAADYAVHSVTAMGNYMTVSVTAQGSWAGPADCALWGAAYEESGKLIDVQSTIVKDTTDAQFITLLFDNNIPANAYARAFLLDKETFSPLCASGDTRNPSNAPENNVYAIFYADGAMVFQYGFTPESGREVKNIYAVNMTGSYEPLVDSYGRRLDAPNTPWYGAAELIQRVEFADKIQPVSTAYWFYGMKELKEIANLTNLDTSNVMTMESMFYYCSNLTELDLSSFRTSHVTTMESMFQYCSNLKTLNVSSFNTAAVTNMNSMFSGCHALTELDVSAFDTSNVTAMAGMFNYCKALTTLDLSAFNTANVTTMEGMFSSCAMRTLDMRNFNTANVTTMERMFAYSPSLTTLDLSGFNTSNVTNMSNMFAYCEELATLDLSGFDTAKVTNMQAMFSKCAKLAVIYASDKFVTVNAYGYGMFYNCGSLVGGSGTTCNGYDMDYDYARIDGGESNPGYFTAKT